MLFTRIRDRYLEKVRPIFDKFESSLKRKYKINKAFNLVKRVVVVFFIWTSKLIFNITKFVSNKITTSSKIVKPLKTLIFPQITELDLFACDEGLSDVEVTTTKRRLLTKKLGYFSAFVSIFVICIMLIANLPQENKYHEVNVDELPFEYTVNNVPDDGGYLELHLDEDICKDSTLLVTIDGNLKDSSLYTIENNHKVGERDYLSKTFEIISGKTNTYLIQPGKASIIKFGVLNGEHIKIEKVGNTNEIDVIGSGSFSGKTLEQEDQDTYKVGLSVEEMKYHDVTIELLDEDATLAYMAITDNNEISRYNQVDSNNKIKTDTLLPNTQQLVLMSDESVYFNIELNELDKEVYDDSDPDNVITKIGGGAGKGGRSRYHEGYPNSPLVDAGEDKLAYEGDVVDFNANAFNIEDIQLFEWDFNFDGSLFIPDSSGQEASCVFVDEGIYFVGLRATYSDSTQLIDTIKVEVFNVAPIITQGISIYSEEHETISFNGDATDPGADSLSYTWDFGDGTQGYGKNVQHSDDVLGVYTVLLTVTDGDGGYAKTIYIVNIFGDDLIRLSPNSDAMDVYYNDNDQWNLEYSDDTLGVNFKNQEMLAILDYDYDGEDELAVITWGKNKGTKFYTWDGSEWELENQTNNHGFEFKNNYHVFGGDFIGDDNDELVQVRTGQNKVSNFFIYQNNEWIITNTTYPHGPVFPQGNHLAGGNALHYSSGKDILIESKSGDNEVTKFYEYDEINQEWALVDEDDAHGAHFAGNDLFAMGEFDHTTTDHEYEDNYPPVAGFYVYQNEIYANDLVEFDTISSGDPDGEILIYDWDFGDGKIAEGANITHRYLDDGMYDVVLTVTDDKGASDTYEKSITILNNAPIASAGPDMVINEDDLIILSGKDSTDVDGNIVNYIWDGEPGNEWITKTYTNRL